MQMSQQTKKRSLHKLKQHWYDILKKHGFYDIEDKYLRLKQPDKRTQAFENRDLVLSFFLCLDSYLNERKDLLPLHRQILELYAGGAKVKKIAKEVDLSYSHTRAIIRVHKKVLLSQG